MLAKPSWPFSGARLSPSDGRDARHQRRLGTNAFMDRIQAAQDGDGAERLDQFGVGFYSAFMVADRVDVISRRAGSDGATTCAVRRQGLDAPAKHVAPSCS